MRKYIELGKVKEMLFDADISMTETETLYKSLERLPTIEIMSKHKYRNYIAYGLMTDKNARCEKCVHWKEQYAPHPYCKKTKKNDFCGDFKETPNCSECEHYEDHHTSLACAKCPVITKVWGGKE